MKPAKKTEKPTSNTDYTFKEKLGLLTYAFFLSKEVFSFAIEREFLKKHITEKEKEEWQKFYMQMWEQCRNADLFTYDGLAYFEFQIRQLLNLAGSIRFKNGKAIYKKDIEFQNVLFPLKFS